MVDVKSAITSDSISFCIDTARAHKAEMSERLWIEGNLSVDYGGSIKGETTPFGLLFDPEEISTGLRVNPEGLFIDHNTYGAEYLDPKPFEVAYFPFAQHFVTTSFPVQSEVKNAEDLEREVARISQSLTRW